MIEYETYQNMILKNMRDYANQIHIELDKLSNYRTRKTDEFNEPVHRGLCKKLG